MNEIIAFILGASFGALCFLTHRATRQVFKVKYRVGDTDIVVEAFSFEELKATMDAAKKFTDDRAGS